MLTILQISDLHRSDDAPVSNELLLDTMLSDIEKHPRHDPRIRPCDVIVVAGDLVSGAKIDDQEARKTLKKQYAQAKDFLLSLAKELVEGDLRRIFIVPGNHDVSWEASRKSMEKIDNIKPSDVWKLLTKPNSQYRWSWSDLSLYRIKNSDEYALRLLDFKEFFDDFYQGFGSTFSLQYQRQTLNFVLPNGKALFSGLCSLDENDCYKLRGQVSIDDVASNNLRMKQSPMKDIPLKLAFWHHSVEASGYNDDRLNYSEILPQLIDHGYAIGLHGHQHRSSVVSYAYSLNPSMVMPIVASGSLCAGPHEIPTGSRRQYNIVEVDDENTRARIHVREWHDNEIWAGARIHEFAGKSFLDVELPILSDSLNQSKSKVAVSLSQTIDQAESAFRAGEYARTLAILEEITADIPLVRKLQQESMQIEGRWKDLITLVGYPRDNDELAVIVEALSKIRDFKKAKQILSECSTHPETYDRSLVNQLQKRLDTLEREHNWRKK